VGELARETVRDYLTALERIMIIEDPGVGTASARTFADQTRGQAALRRSVTGGRGAAGDAGAIAGRPASARAPVCIARGA